MPDTIGEKNEAGMAIEPGGEHFELFERWAYAHRTALEAEHLAAQRNALPESTQILVAQMARELRGSADALFSVLLDRKAFPNLAPMPQPSTRSGRAASPRDLN